MRKKLGIKRKGSQLIQQNAGKKEIIHNVRQLESKKKKREDKKNPKTSEIDVNRPNFPCKRQIVVSV